MESTRSIRTILVPPLLLLALFILCPHPQTLTAATPATDQIGVITAVHGAVTLEHPGGVVARPAKINDSVLFKDVIETQDESRTKALLTDDTLLTVGEHSRVEITEYIIDPNRKSLLVTVNLVKGKVRALVGKLFTGSGSRFEVHTSTMVAAARGTYYVAWIEGGASGAANIGTHGRVEVIASGRSVMLHPGEFSLAKPTGPTPPAVLSVRAPAVVSGVIRGTEVREVPKLGTAREFLMKSGVSEAIEFPVVSLSGQASGGNQGAGNGNGGGNGNGVTPPAPVSGASKGKKEIEHEENEHGEEERERNREIEEAKKDGDEKVAKAQEDARETIKQANEERDQRLTKAEEDFNKKVSQAAGNPEELAKAQAQYDETVTRTNAETQVKVASAQAVLSEQIVKARVETSEQVARVETEFAAKTAPTGQEEIVNAGVQQHEKIVVADAETQVTVASAQADYSVKVTTADADYQLKVVSANADYMIAAATPGLSQEELVRFATERDQKIALATEEFIMKTALAGAERTGRISNANAKRAEMVTRAIREQVRKVGKAGSRTVPPLGTKPTPVERHPFLPSSTILVKPKPIRVSPLPKPPSPPALGLTSARGRK